MTEFVLLGVADIAIGAKNASWRTNKIGGKADWIGDDAGSPICLQCKRILSLAIQVYCPLNNSTFHRTLYVFCCNSKECWITSKGWKIYRAQCSQVENKLTESKKALTGKLFDSWGDNDDDWGDDDVDVAEWEKSAGYDTEMANLADFSAASNKLQSLRLEESHSVANFTDAEPDHVLESFYINVFDESDCVKTGDDDKHIEDMISKYKKFEQINSELSCAFNITEKETYEKDDVKDRLFHKFWKKINVFPSQVIRYSWNGFPLLISDNPRNFSVPKCQYCGSERTFEFQLMPALIRHLKVSEKDEHIEFGTVLFYSCSKSCWDKKIQEEHVEYFPDPDLKYFKTQTVK